MLSAAGGSYTLSLTNETHLQFMPCRSGTCSYVFELRRLSVSLLDLRLTRNTCEMYIHTVTRANAIPLKARCILAIFLQLVRTILPTTKRSLRTMYTRGWPRLMPLTKNIHILRQVIAIPLWSSEDQLHALTAVVRHRSAISTSNNAHRCWARRANFSQEQ